MHIPMKKILYVEDDEDTAEAVKVILESEGFNTDLASTGKDALLKVVTTEGQFDLIIVDIILPDMTGWQILRKLKEADVRTNYLIMSSVPLTIVGKERLDFLGVKDCIMKPFEREDLIARVKRVLDS